MKYKIYKSIADGICLYWWNNRDKEDSLSNYTSKALKYMNTKKYLVYEVIEGLEKTHTADEIIDIMINRIVK